MRACFRRGAAAAVVAVAMTGAAAADTLTDALIGAYRSSGLIEQNRALVRAADEDVATAIAALRPVINYLGQTTYSSPPERLGADNLQTIYGLSANLTLYDGGARQYAVDANKETVLAARESLRGVEQDVLFRAVQAYFNVLRATQFVDLAQGSVRVIGQELQAAEDRFEVGEVTRTDIALAEASLAGSRSNLASAQGDLAQAREEYRAVVGRYPGPLMPAPAPPAMVSSLEQAIGIARQRHPAIAEAQRQTQVAEINVLRAAASMGPTLNLTGQATWDEGGDNRNSVGLEVTGPIYQGGQLSALLRQARAQRDATRGGLHDVVRQTELAVGNAWSVLAVSDAGIRARGREVEASTVALRGTTEESRLGARTTLDVLNAEQDLLDARANLVSTQIDRQIAVYGIWRAMGILTVEELDLGIATYDPADYYNAVRDAPVRNVSPQGQKLDHVLRKLLR